MIKQKDLGRTDIKEDVVQTAKDRITKEKETDKKKHDKMMDRARIQQARQKNMETEEVHRKTVASMMEQSVFVLMLVVRCVVTQR